MGIQATLTAVRPQASFLRGGIADHFLPFADIAPLVTRRAAPMLGSGSVGIDCSLNQHIPTCNPHTLYCSYECPTPATSNSYCPTREFVC